MTTSMWGEWVAKGVRIVNAVYLPRPSRGRAIQGRSYTNLYTAKFRQKVPVVTGGTRVGELDKRQTAPKTQQKPTIPLGIAGRAIAG